MKVRTLVIAVLLVSILLAGCTPEPTPTPVPATAVPTEAPTVAPTVAPTAGASATADDPAYYEGEPVAVIPPGEPGKPMITASYNTVIMGGPGPNYVVYGAFLGGQTAIAVGTSADGLFYVINVPVAPDSIGWVPAAYVVATDAAGLPIVEAPPVPPTVEMVPPAPEDPQATVLADTYIRNGPGSSYPAYGIAKTGNTGRVIGKSEDGTWLVVRLDPAVVGLGYGWVEAAFVQASNIETVAVIGAPVQDPPIETAPPADPTSAYATALDWVNIRSGPGTNYYIYGAAAPGASAPISGKSQDGLWWQIIVPVEKISAGVAWVSADWVSAVNAQNVPVVAAPPPPPTTVEPTPAPTTSCILVSQNPADYTTFPTSTGFGVQWVLQNTSTVAWDQGLVDLVYLGAIDGQRLHQNYDLYDITQTVQPGETYSVDGSMITPQNPGQYGEAWSLQSNGTVLCTFWIIVNAQ